MHVEPYLQRAFRFDASAPGPTVDLVVATTDELFNPLDGAPVFRRDLAPAVKQFFDDCTQWLPPELPLTVDVWVRDAALDPSTRDGAVDGLRHYFDFLVEHEVCALAARRRRIVSYVVAGAACVVAVAMLGLGTDADSFALTMVRTGLTVGAWVFLWETVSALFIRRSDDADRLARLRRLATAQIRIREQGGGCIAVS